ncbi:unnamed protein product, partial [Ascophyllum nodosum]
MSVTRTARRTHEMAEELRLEEECRMKKRKCASLESEENFPDIRRKVAGSRRRKRRRLEPPPPPATVSGDGGALRVEARTVRP